MKFTLSWLKEHLETEVGLAEICEALPMLGLEVEELVNPAEKLAPFTIAHVIEAIQHPNADRLRVCKVETGDGIIQVVCGAPNARTGMKGVFAPSGSHIPGTGIDLKKGVIRGEESNGMLCSEREMGLSDEHDGIIELPEDAPVGASFAAYAGLDDPVIDIAITPDRADCLGVRGIARDLAAAGLGTLKPLDIPEVPGTFKSPIGWDVDLPDPSLAPCVAGRYFRNVQNGPSPKWMQDRLTAIGLRPISALVDITNYMMMDVGRPLHAYDADRISGGAIRIRLSRAGESYTALNEKTYTFDDGMLVLGDADGIDDMAGIMGGARTGCTGETVNMFLEVAIFDPVSVAMTGRRQNIISDARYRFERGLDPTGPGWGLHLATKLVQEICGGEASEPVLHGQEEDWKRTITLRHSRIRSLGGVDIAEGKAKRILADLGFGISGAGEAISAVVPPWRRDVEGEACLVEEILRINGYDNIPAIPLPREQAATGPVLSRMQVHEGRAKRVLSARGMLEAVTFSFLSRGEAELFGGGAEELTLVNPISSALDVMRPSLLPNLLAAAARNANMGTGDAALFEVGPQYADAAPEGQARVVAGLRVGRTGPKDWAGTSRAVDVFDAKADALALLEALEAPAGNLQVRADNIPPWYHPGRSGALCLGPNILARFGELHPKVLKAMDVKGPAVAFEIFPEKIPVPKSRGSARPFLRLSPFQPLTRDFAFVVNREIPAEKLLRAAAGADKALISGARLFDEYQGEGLEADEKSLAIQVTLQPLKATLTDEEIEAVSRRIIAQVEKATGGHIRA